MVSRSVRGIVWVRGGELGLEGCVGGISDSVSGFSEGGFPVGDWMAVAGNFAVGEYY